MRYAQWVTIAAIVTGACAGAPAERQVVLDAADALGGVEQVQALASFSMEGEGESPNIGQNRLPDSELPVWGVSDFVRVVDLANGRSSTRQVRTAQFQFAGATVQRQHTGLDGDVAYNVTPDGQAFRAGAQAVRDRRIEVLHHPIASVRAALHPMAVVANLRQEGNEDLVDIETADGDIVTLAIDRDTKLPSRVQTMAAHPNLGDVRIVTTFREYENVDGIQMPRRLTTMLDGYLQFDLRTSRNAVAVDTGSLATPDDVRSAPEPSPPGIRVDVEPVAQGIWRLAGTGNHRSIVFEFDDHLLLFEVPQNEARSKMVIDTARTLSPKPLTHAVVSHHHFDHSGGLRVAVAEGLTIITHRLNEALFRDLVSRPHTLVPDALSLAPPGTPLKLELVDDTLTLEDSSMEVRLYHLLDNPREGTNLYAYVPRGRILVQADLYDSTWLQHLWGENVLENLARRKLRVDRSVPVHGPMEPFADMVRNIKTKTGVPPAG
jgi:glyoxylase-like metal-dependent hydrolase (beta-lactamase superfamily II)